MSNRQRYSLQRQDGGWLVYDRHTDQSFPSKTHATALRECEGLNGSEAQYLAEERDRRALA